jgi:UDP-N-acetylmuramoyl-tripeptide--D-alanyl-D-alanine ligase
VTRVLTLADVRAALAGSGEARGSFDSSPATFCIDSREVTPGSTFLGLRGSRVDGNSYAEEAVARGAALVISERDVEAVGAAIRVKDSLAALGELARWWRRQLGTRTIGITGSVGKTTTKELLADVLSTKAPTLRNEANWNTEIGVPLTLLRLTDNHRWAVLEMAMRANGQIRELARIAEPEVGVVTNVGQVHAEQLGSMDAIAWAKSELIQELPARGLAVLNADDPRVAAMAGKAACRVVTYGIRGGADIRAEVVEPRSLEGLRLSLAAGEHSADVEMKLPGRHNALNAAAAAAVALNEGFTLAEATAALGQSNPYRLQQRPGIKGSLIIDDSYNASPASMRAALDLLADAKGRHIAVIGDMRELGQYEEESHGDIGVYAAQRADVIVAVGEKSRMIVDAARLAGHPSAHAYMSKSDAVDDVKRNLRAGDVVLVKASRALGLETVVAALEIEN